MAFSEKVLKVLQANGLQSDSDLSHQLQSVFPLLFLPRHQLAIHLVNIDAAWLSSIQPDFFARLTDRALAQQLRIVHLWEDVWKAAPTLASQRLLSLCGISTRLHGRQTIVRRIDKHTADTFLEANHLQGTATAYYKYALLNKETPVAVATFSKSRTMKDGAALYRSYELVRFATQYGISVNGGLGKLLQHFIEAIGPAHIMTFADRDWGTGKGYSKLGFTLEGNTEPQQFLIHPREMKRHYPHRLPAGFESVQQMCDAGYISIYNSGNAKYVLDRRP